MESYSVRRVFQCPPRNDQTRKYIYEERITLWQAESFEQAIKFAETDVYLNLFF